MYARNWYNCLTNQEQCSPFFYTAIHNKNESQGMLAHTHSCLLNCKKTLFFLYLTNTLCVIVSTGIRRMLGMNAKTGLEGWGRLNFYVYLGNSPSQHCQFYWHMHAAKLMFMGGKQLSSTGISLRIGRLICRFAC